MATKQPEVLFHYTTEAGLYGILETQTIWATHYAFTNDALEMRRAEVALARSIMPEIQEVYLGRLKAREIELKPEHSHLSPEEIAQYEAEAFFDAIWRAENDELPCFITSFCGAPEADDYTLKNGLLSQWRAYGGSGYAIEFDYENLFRAVQLEEGCCTHSGYEMSAVQYVMDPEADLPFQDDANLIRALAKKIFEDLDRAEDEISQIHLPVLRCRALTKDWAFHEEREIRIFHSRPVDEHVPKSRPRPKAIHFAGSGIRVPHICLFDHPDIDLPIRRVIIGPHRASRLRKQALELFRAERGLKFDVHISEIPLLER